jgi:hypothetical protein
MLSMADRNEAEQRLVAKAGFRRTKIEVTRDVLIEERWRSECVRLGRPFA